MTRRIYALGGVLAAIVSCLSAAAGFIEASPWLVPKVTQSTYSYEVPKYSLPSISIEREVAGDLRAIVASAARVEQAVNAETRLSLPPDGLKDFYCTLVATEGGLPLFAAGTNRPLHIASVSKLFTTTAALLALGPEWRFETKLFLSQDVRDGGHAESAYLVGSGDPYLVSAEFEEFWRNQVPGGPVTRLEELADEIARSGVRSISTLYADSSLYDELPYPFGISQELIEQRVLPPVSALAVDRNLVRWEKERQAAVFASDPAYNAVARLAIALSRRGIAIRKLEKAPLRNNASYARVFAVKSAPLRELVKFVNAHSDNFAAEMLAKRVAATEKVPGSWSGFWPRAKQLLSDIGAALENTRLDEGSGLTGNFSTCGDVTSLLVAARSGPLGEFVVKSLATPKGPGTLTGRFDGVSGAERVEAKTGSLRMVSALAGFVEATNGSAVVFSVISNGSDAPRAHKELEDPLVEKLIASTN